MKHEIEIINTSDKVNIACTGYENKTIITISDKTVITISDKEKYPLSSFNPGSIVKIGDYEFIVLEQRSDNITAVITKKFVKRMEFGESGDYTKSYVRGYCNGEFYKELVKAVGKDNIVKHIVNLMADDGTGKGKVVQDNVSILTTDLYRRYRAFLPSYGDWWWTATRVSDDDSLGYARGVCCVLSNGVLGWDGRRFPRGVRPYFHLKSNVLVEEV